MDACHIVVSVNVSVEAFPIVGLYVKSISHYKLKQAIERQLLQGKRLFKRSKWKRRQKSLINSILILSQVKKHYKVSSTIHLMKELMIS